MNEDSGSVARLAPDVVLHPKISESQPLPDAAAVLIGQLADNTHLFSDSEYSVASGRRGDVFLVVGFREKDPEDISFAIRNPHLSPSRDKLVVMISREKDQRQPSSSGHLTLMSG